MRNCHFDFVAQRYKVDEKEYKKCREVPDWIEVKEDTAFIRADDMSKNVHFIISGKVHIMDKDGLYLYGSIGEGAMFGEISLLRDEPEEFSYYYDKFQTKPIQLLTMPAKEFNAICEQYPFSK